MKHMALKKNLDVTIHEAFLEEILQGNWKPGQALNLDDLAERYGVSRTPIQQALKRMHTQGMVVFSSKGHFSVPTFSEKEVCDIIEMRLLLEHQALTDIQNKLLPMDFETLERLAGECVASNKTSNIVRTRRTDLDFHRILVEQAGNRCLSEVYDRIQGQFIVANYLLTSHTRSQQQVASDDHERLLAALKEPDCKLKALLDLPSLQKFLQSPKDYGAPWYGQLMAGPQMIAYLLQIHYFFQEYKVNLIL